MFQINHASQAQYKLQNRGHRCCQSDVKKRSTFAQAHKVGHRNTHAERADDSLDHHEFCHADTVVETGVTEEYRGKKAIDRISLQVVDRSGNNTGIG